MAGIKGLLHRVELGSIEITGLPYPLFYTLYQYSSAYVLHYTFDGRCEPATVTYTDGDLNTSSLQGDTRIILPLRAWCAAYILYDRPSIVPITPMRMENRSRFMKLFEGFVEEAANDLSEMNPVPIDTLVNYPLK